MRPSRRPFFCGDVLLQSRKGTLTYSLECRFGKFKCYCDSTTEKTKAQIESTSEDIERMDALIADKTAQNTAYSQEAAKLEADMAENQKGQGEATTTRGKEQEAFEKEEEDLVLEW